MSGDNISNLQKEKFDELYAEKGNPDHIIPDIIKKKMARLEKKGVIAGKKILDVGCGDGYLLKSLGADYEKHGVDISSVVVKKLRAEGIEAVESDVSNDKLPFEDAVFDIVASTEMLEHIPNPAFVIAEAYRVLKPGGLFICSTPNLYNWTTPILMLLDIPPINSAHYHSLHYRDFTKKVLKKALRENRFVVTKITGDIMYPFMGPVSKLIASIFPRRALRLIAFSMKPVTEADK